MKNILFLLTLAACSTSSKKEVQATEVYQEIPSVKIGELYWSNTNLSVDTFQNGDRIREAKSAEEWVDLSKKREPGFCYYNFDSTNNLTHGRLYNWFAASDARNIAPIGWHVATNEEWEQLIQTAGGIYKAGTKLKATSGWEDPIGEPTGQGTDDLGFAAGPTGEIHNDGVFSSFGAMGVYWTSSDYTGPTKWNEKSGLLAWDIVIWYSANMAVKRQTFPKIGSGAIRCVRNY